MRLSWHSWQRQKQKLLELEEAGGKLMAPQAGMIMEVYIQTGQRTTDTAAVTLTDTSAGLYLYPGGN